MNKNDYIEITITDMTDQGEGIGKTEGGYTFFVKHAIVGDTVRAIVTKVKKNYSYATVQELLKPSPWRVEAPCKIARACGGCQLQEMAYEKQLQWKREKVLRQLEKIGGLKGFTNVYPTLGMEDPWRYRNKTQLPVGCDKTGRYVVGFYAGHTHHIIAQEDCLLADEKASEIAHIVLDFMNQYQVPPYEEATHRGLVRHLLLRKGFATGEWMVCLVLNGNQLPYAKELVRKLQVFPEIKSIVINVNRERTNVILGQEILPLYGQTYIEDKIGDIRFQISALSFFQVNPVQTKRLYETALEYAGLTGKEDVWDLYCGIGTISLFLARSAKRVRGVEIIPQAIKNAEENARLNQIENAEFFVGKAEEVVPHIVEQEHCHADVIVVDPPRKGCEPILLDTMLKMEPSRIVYVSCDPATLARDLRYLTESGKYCVEKVQPVDMFPMSGHVECVVLLSKLKTAQHIEVELQTDELDLTTAESKATYDEIRAYVKEQTGLTVSSLNVAQAKEALGMDKRENFNKPKSDSSRQPKCPEDKKEAIIEALRHFKMI